MSRVVIIGAGISGLASAALLGREGHEVTVLEQRSSVGGRAGSIDDAGFRFDAGPSWYLMPEVFDHFYRLLGTTADEQIELVTLDPGYRVFFEDHDDPIEIAQSREANLALFESIEPGSAARLDAYLESARETYDLALRRFLYSSFESLRPVFARDVLARTGRFMRLLTESLDSRVSRTVTDERLRQVLGYPAVFLGASPFTAPSMYHLMSHLDLQDGVRYPLGGFIRIIESIEQLALAEGARIQTDARVTGIRVEAGRAVGVEFERAGEPGFAEADVVVSAADVHHTETALLEPQHQSFPESYWSKRDPGPSAVLVYLGVRGRVPELQHHSLFFTSDWRENFDAIYGESPRVLDPASIYVCKPSGVDPSVAPDGHENLFVLVPVPADVAIGGGGADGDGDARVETIADRAIRQIADWAGIPDLAERVVVRRTVGPRDFADGLSSWRGGALGPAHTLRQSAFFRTPNTSRRVKNLHYVGGSTIPGVGLPMCLISAEVLLKRMRGDTSTEPLAEPLSAAEAP